MATWAEIRAWDPDGLAEASDSLRTMGKRLSSLHEDAELALTQVASQSQGVNAIRAELRSSVAEHGEVLERVGSLHTASADAYEGLLAVRRKVLECQDYADSNPHLSLAADGTVTAILPASGGASGTTATVAASTSAAGANADAKLIQSQADELAGMVAAAVTLANQVDADYARALNTTSRATANSGSHSFSWTKNSDTDKPRTGRVFPWGGRQSNNGGGTGHATNKTGLGNPVPGEHADMPGVDPWQYPGDSENEGSGKYAQRIPTPHDHVVHELATLAAGVCESVWPDASKNLYHYLQNTGEPQDINVDNMLTDLPDLPTDAQADAEWMASQAVADAKTSDISGPVTYPFNTEWTPEYAEQYEDQNWFLATGGYYYCTDGTITVYPPTDSNPEWTYSYDYRVHVADRYNWDGNKSTTINGITVTDKELQELHKAGLAKEYDLVGESSVQHGTGP